MRLAARRVPMLVVGLLSMACGTWLGLVRLGWNLPLPWPDQLIAHAIRGTQPDVVRTREGSPLGPDDTPERTQPGPDDV